MQFQLSQPASPAGQVINCVAGLARILTHKEKTDQHALICDMMTSGSTGLVLVAII